MIERLSLERPNYRAAGTPTTPGTSSVTVTANDATGTSGTTSFTWTISTS